MLGEQDRAELERLAARDTSQVPAGALLGATVDGELVAALSLTSRELIADPFVPTADVRALLADRVVQLNGNGDGRRGLLDRLRRRRSRAALPSSPPGAGGRLLEI